MVKRTFLKKLWSLSYLTAGGAVMYSGLSIYQGNEKFYKDVFIPFLHRLDPETSHNLAIMGLKYKLVPQSTYIDGPELKTRFLDKDLSNPIGIAAGFDKHGEAIDGLRKLGFGFIEIGSVTPNPQPGNDKPRVFRLPEDEAVINRYGFNSEGHAKVLERLNKLKFSDSNENVLGVNLGKNKTSEDSIKDYITGVEIFGSKTDYIVINISSPNTPGLRNLQTKDHLYKLLSNIVEAKNTLNCIKKPFILLKLAPDLSKDEKADIAKILNKRECKVDGLIISNTTIQRTNIVNKEFVNEVGGLSGRPLKDTSTELIRDMYKLTKGVIPIIGVGGISSGKDAFEKILAGATAVQIYTAFIYNGPPIVAQIKSELSAELKSHGFQCVNDAIGKESSIKK